DFRFTTLGKNLCSKRFGAGAAVCEVGASDNLCWNAGLFGERQAAGFRGTGNDQANIDRQPASGGEVDEILQRATGAGDEDSEFEFGIWHQASGSGMSICETGSQAPLKRSS